MLFNNLQDLIFKEQIFTLNEQVSQFNSITDEDTRIFDKIIEICMQKYKTNLKNMCNGFQVISYDLFLNNYVLLSGEYKEEFRVSQKLYKYCVCVLFLDNNSLITFFNKLTYQPTAGELYIFPSSWFFTFEVSNNTNTLNQYIINNIVNSIR
jgi:hypothetical protein